MKITVLTVGKIKEKYLRDAIAEYTKRLSRYCKLEIIEVADEKTPDNASENAEEMIRQKEAERLLKYIREDAYLITLEIGGKQLTSEEFSEKIEKLGIQGTSHIIFVIGGSIGIGKAVLENRIMHLVFKNDISAPADACNSARANISWIPDHVGRTLSQIEKRLIHMKMVVLVENSSRCRLCAEHGLSVYIEYEGKTYLLDTGATALFAENAKELGIDLSEVDTAFLSHAHYDHSGGFEEFFKENDKAAVYMQEASAENCFYRTEGKDKYIGIPQHLLENYKERFRPLNAVCEVEKGVWVVPHFTGGLDEMGRRAHMYRKIGEEFIADDFAH